MLAMPGQPHMLLGRGDRSMRDAWAPGLPWLSRPDTKLGICVESSVRLKLLDIHTLCLPCLKGVLCHAPSGGGGCEAKKGTSALGSCILCPYMRESHGKRGTAYTGERVRLPHTACPPEGHPRAA